MRSVFKILALTGTLLVLGSNLSFSQVVGIWSEDFSTYANDAVTAVDNRLPAGLIGFQLVLHVTKLITLEFGVEGIKQETLMKLLHGRLK